MDRRSFAVCLFVSLIVSLVVVAPPVPPGSVRINEIAWGGTPAGPAHEWIELVNTTGAPIVLDGWRLTSSDGAPDILLSGMLAPLSPFDSSAGYFLLERGSDNAVPERPADMIYAGALRDSGEVLSLFDADGHIIDTANGFHAPTEEGVPWPAGAAQFGAEPFATMERTDYRRADDPTNWTTSRSASESGTTPGTPGSENSAFNIPPSAALQIHPPVPQPGRPVVFDAGASQDENDAIILYTWDFGDGTTAQRPTQTVSHSYARAGRYGVTLTIEDAKGGIAFAQQEILVMTSQPPTADFSIRTLSGPRYIRTGDTLLFQDESNDEDGPIVRWDWHFGDDTSSTESDPEHAYSRAGTYIIALSIEDAQGDRSTQTQSITVANRPPTAAFNVETEKPNQGQQIALDASASFDEDGTLQTYRWNLANQDAEEYVTGDPKAAYSLAEGGDLTITLVVVDDLGERSLPVSDQIYVNHAPVAQFRLSTFQPAENEALLIEDCSHDVDGTVQVWEWDFGDGNTSQQPSPSHTYTTSGAYEIRLEVLDELGATGTATASVTVRNLAPVAALAVSPVSGPTGSAFSLDASTSDDPSPNGEIVLYEWDTTGDGTFDQETSVPTLSVSYGENGVVPVKVRVTDDRGATSTSAPQSITVTNRPPRVISFQFSPVPATDGDRVAFTSQAVDDDGTVVNWLWDFGDGTKAETAVPSHRFSADGDYSVAVTVTDNDGTRSAPLSKTVTIANAAPVATFTTARASCPHGIAFDATSSYDPSPNGMLVHLAWDFGDGTTCPGTADACDGTDRTRVQHCYSASGTYTVTLVVIDDEGAIGRSVQQITVP